jgi:hypothetical protein
VGTSVNQRSPARPTWKLPQALLGRTDRPPEDQAREIWRAASLDPDTDIGRRLSASAIANACAIAQATQSTTDAMKKFDAVLVEGRTSGFVYDLARRALVRTVADGSGAAGFGRELFAETVAYYVSRDLPSYVGKAGRIATASESIALKKKIQDQARAAADRHPIRSVSEGSWASFVSAVVASLTGRGRR